MFFCDMYLQLYHGFIGKVVVVFLSIVKALKRTRCTKGRLDAALNINRELEGTSGKELMVIDRLTKPVDELGTTYR